MENCVLALFISFIISTFSLSTGATFITGMEIYKGQGDSGLVIGDSYYEFYQPKDSKTPYKKPTEGAISFEGAWYVPYVPPVPTEEALKREKKKKRNGLKKILKNM